MIFQSFALPSFSTLKTHKIGMTKIWHINKENTCSNPHFWVSEKKFDFQSLASYFIMLQKFREIAPNFFKSLQLVFCASNIQF